MGNAIKAWFRNFSDISVDYRIRLFYILALGGIVISLPALVLVQQEGREDEVPLLEAGADDWVQKPYQMDVLQARMVALLRQKQG